MCSSAASLILSLSLALSLTVVLSKLNFCSSAPPRRGKSAMPMCSMEQKRCISVASREGDEGGKGKKERSERENMEMTSWVEALKIFTPLLPPPFPSLARSLPPSSVAPVINISPLLDVIGRGSPAPPTSCQPEVGAAADDLIWPDDGSSRLAG